MNMSKRQLLSQIWTAFLLWSAITVLCFIYMSQPRFYNALIVKTDIELDETQAKILKNINQKPSTINSMVVSFSPEHVNDEKLMLQLAEKTLIFVRQLEAVKVTKSWVNGVEVPVQNVNKNKIVWMGKDNHGILTYLDDDIKGFIYFRARLFNLEPLGNKLHVIYETNQSKVGED